MFAVLVILAVPARADDTVHFIDGVEKQGVHESKSNPPTFVGGSYEYQSGDLPNGGSYSRHVLDLQIGGLVELRTTSLGTPVLVSFFAHTRIGTAGDFSDPMDMTNLGVTAASSLVASFVYPLVTGSVGLSIEPGLDVTLEYDMTTWKIQVPWEDTTHAAAFGAVHAGARIAKNVVLGLDLRATPFVNATSPYDDVNQLRGGLRLDTLPATLRLDISHGHIKGNDMKSGMLDGHETVVGLTVLVHVF